MYWVMRVTSTFQCCGFINHSALAAVARTSSSVTLRDVTIKLGDNK
jgi:hypothetical protein